LRFRHWEGGSGGLGHCRRCRGPMQSRD